MRVDSRQREACITLELRSEPFHSPSHSYGAAGRDGLQLSGSRLLTVSKSLESFALLAHRLVAEKAVATRLWRVGMEGKGVGAKSKARGSLRFLRFRRRGFALTALLLAFTGVQARRKPGRFSGSTDNNAFDRRSRAPSEMKNSRNSRVKNELPSARGLKSRSSRPWGARKRCRMSLMKNFQ